MKDEGTQITEWLINEQLSSLIHVSSLLVELTGSGMVINGEKPTGTINQLSVCLSLSPFR